MIRPPPVWPYALAVSILLHGLLLGAWMGGTLPETEPSPRLIEAQLVPAPQPVLSPPASPPKAAPRLKTEPTPASVAPTGTAPTQAVAEAEIDAPDLPEAVTDLAAPAAPDPVPTPAPPVEAAAPPLNPLPPRLDLRFDVRYGFARGEQTLVWVNAGDTYTVTSVAAATGLVGVFYSGRFAQTSRGRITPLGLVPEEFWDQRGARRSTARFDVDGGTLTYSPPQGAPRHFAYRAGAQDVLSLFFQLALTAPPPDGRVEVEVFNGKRLRHYAYEVRGETLLETALGPLRVLHLARMANEDGRFELWLAIDRHYLPVRVLRTDDKGNEVELTVASIEP